MNVIAVGLGGAVGALLRYWVGMWVPVVHTFPLNTLLINLAGCLFLGWFFTATSARWRIPPILRLGIGTGMTGAFTTFSTFSVETVHLVLQQHFLIAIAYVLTSLIAGLILIWLGGALAR